MMVLENTAAMPPTKASARVNPNAAMTPKPTAKNAAVLPSAVTTDAPSMVRSLLGGRSSPSRNSRKMMPISPMSSTKAASGIQPRAWGPSTTPRPMYATSRGWRV